MIDLDPLLDSLLDATCKGFPPASAPLRVRDVGTRHWRLFSGELPMPQAVLSESALAHNEAWMRDFTQSTGVLLAPHGKTTMAPQLFARQLAAGAWGMTVATAQQLAVCVGFGIRRVLMANQLLGDAEVTSVLALQAAHPDLEFHFLVDSIAQLEAIEAVAARHSQARRLSALVEIGIPSGRTGCRTHDEAMALARRIAASPAVGLGGLECYEGGLVTGDSAHDAEVVTALMQRMRDAALACDQEGCFSGPGVILSAGGSAAFDVVARELPTRLSLPVQVILRSGCYVTHDSGQYARLLEGIKERSGPAWQNRPGLRPALEVWSRVQSCPEPGLAILTMGKRDVSFDLELPIVAKVVRASRIAGAAGAVADASNLRPKNAPDGWRIAALNDQHGYLRFPEDAADAPRVGDLIGCGISHPCTTFDKWRVLYTVDDDYRVTGAIRTYF